MKNVSPERWRRIDVLLDGALDREPEERAAYLDEACGDDPHLRREVESLLEAEKGTPGFLDGQALAFADPFLPDVAEEWVEEGLAEGDRIGPYRLIEEAGRGGMATVYRAERADGAFEQEVAIKLLPPGKGTEAVLRRFEHEQHVLATLNQPNIARLYDGGLTEDGRPYFVMEYVAGQPIDQYCDAHRLPIRARLQLFRTVAEAVHYAHRNLVVHRDLKPSNILVTEDGTVKLLDFGIAKLLAGTEGEADLLTQTGERWMTPGYAAPEQVRGEMVTTATDVYQLGVVLYELLAGRRPYHVEGRSTFEIERAICEEEPTRPSVIVTRPLNVAQGDTSAGEMLEDISRARSTGIEKLRKDLSGDLDAIILKALRKEPEARFASAESFAEDVKRYLNSEPVKARRGSRVYRARKFIGRHWQGVSTAALIALLLVGYAVTATVQSARARAQADKFEQVSDFLVEIFLLSDPGGTTSSDITARELLERSARQIESGLAELPEVQAEIQHVLGRIYHNLGLYEEGIVLLEAALTTRRERYDAPHPDLASTLDQLAASLTQRENEGDQERARSLFTESLAMWRDLPDGEIEAAGTMINFGILQRELGEPEEAEQLYRDALSLMRSSDVGDHKEVAFALSNLAVAIAIQGRTTEAEPFMRDAIAMKERLYGREHWSTAVSIGHLAGYMTELERFESADSLYRETIAIKGKLLAPDHPSLAIAYFRWGRALHTRGLYAEAEPMYQRALEIYLVMGEAHPYVAATLRRLGELRHDQGNLVAADSLYQRKLEIDRNNNGEDSPEVGADWARLADVAYDMGAHDRAGLYYQRALRLLSSPGDSLSRSYALVGYARLLARLGRAAEAEPFARDALTIRQANLPGEL